MTSEHIKQIGETGVIWTGFCFYRVGRFLIIRFVK